MSRDRSLVYLRDQRGDLVEAQLVDGVGERSLADVEELWRPMLEVAAARARSNREASLPRLEHAHWDWRAKIAAVRALLAFRSFTVECGGATQGLMCVRTTELGKLSSQQGKPLVYMDYLEVAPWNLRQIVAVPRFVGVGTALLAAAISRSMKEGFLGRIGLHSLPQSESFYRRCGLEALGRDPAKESLRYFEMTPEKARSFLSKEE